jgi:S1-C subfamily serine protease
MGTTLAALSADISALAATAAASTVTIGRNGRGSGIVIGTDEILTSAHNLRDRTTQVTLPDGTEVQAELVASDSTVRIRCRPPSTASAPPTSSSWVWCAASSRSP